MWTGMTGNYKYFFLYKKVVLHGLSKSAIYKTHLKGGLYKRKEQSFVDSRMNRHHQSNTLFILQSIKDGGGGVAKKLVLTTL